jgi:hypothetical protein
MVDKLCYNPEGCGFEANEVIDFPNLPNPSSRSVALGLTEPLTEISTRKCLWGVEHGRRVKLATSSPFVSLLSRKCEILDISQA